MAVEGFPWQSPNENGFGFSPQTKETALEQRQSPSATPPSVGPILTGETTNTLNEKTSTGDTSFSRNEKLSLSRKSLNNTEYAPPSSQQQVRTIPPWIQSVEEDDLIQEYSPGNSPTTPTAAFVAQHNHSPSTSRTRHYIGHLNHERNVALLSSLNHPPRESRWVTFAKASAYPHEELTGEKVQPDWLNEHFGDYSKPWLSRQEEEAEGDDESGRYQAFQSIQRVWYKRMQFTLFRNPFIPLVFRLIIFFFAAIALALGGSIYHLADKAKISRGASAEMAIIVDAVAMVYILGITYDEYRGKPLGLRSARAKLRIVLLDLFFIVFESANLSLAFQSMSYPGEGCSVAKVENSFEKTNSGICERQEALASVLLVALIAWLMTFSVSVIRLVERVVQK